MKEKLILLTTLLALQLLPMQAKEVSSKKAETIANQIIKTTQTGITTRSSSGLSLVHTEYESGSDKTRSANVKKNKPTYYIFNKGNNSGFIIISADDVITPLLGYTTTGNYDANNLPANFSEWTEGLSDQIAYAINNKIKQSPETKAQWSDYTTLRSTSVTNSKSVKPLTNTSWNQFFPYNNLCPENSVTGCSATAMAQIMKYYNYPKSRTVSIPAYTTPTNGYKIDAIPATTYDWDNMLNKYGSALYTAGSSSTVVVSDNSTTVQNKAVATLMYHCGVSMQMNYTQSQSGATMKNVGRAFANYFDYDKSIQLKQRQFYNDQEWINMLYTELDAGRPIAYAGYNSNNGGGHAFVCDGYDESGLFHINWGWGGSGDGYFVTTALNPLGKSTNSGYNYNQEIIINIKPNAGGTNSAELSCKLSIENPKLARGETFIIDEIVWNKGLFPFSGEFGFALVDNNDKIIAVTGQIRETLDINSGAYARYVQNTIPKSIAPGDYSLRFIQKEDGQSEWSVKNNLGELSITISNDPVLNISKLIFREVIELSVNKTTLAQGEYFEMSGYLWNRSGDSFSGIYAIAIVDDKDNIINIAEERTLALANNYYTYLTNLRYAHIPSTTAPGNYFLRVVTKAVGESDWALVNGTSSYVNKIPITVTVSAVTRSLNQLEIYNPDGKLSALNIYAEKGLIYVNSDQANPIKEVSVYNINGVIEHHSVMNTSSFISNYTRPGLYVVKVKTNNGVESKKLIVK